MGLVSFVLLVAFSILYLSKSLPSKPAFLTTAVEKIEANLEKISLYGAIFAGVCIVLTPVLIYSGANMLVRLVANILIVLMALPTLSHGLLPKYQDRINPAIYEELRNFVGWIGKQERYIAYAGVGVSVLMFLILFT